MARSKPAIALGSIIAARWVTFGAVRAPRKSADGSRSARAVAIAYRNTMLHVLRRRRAVSYLPRTSMRRSRARISSAVISAIGRSPNAANAKSSSHRCFARVAGARPSRSSFLSSSSATTRKVFPAACLSSLRLIDGSIPAAKYLRGVATITRLGKCDGGVGSER